MTSPRITPALWVRGLIAGVAATIVNLIVFLIGHAGGASMQMTSPQQMTIGVPAVIGASLVPLTIAGIIVGLLTRRWSRARIVLT